MFFKRKDKNNKLKCSECNSEIEKKFNFCPYCGLSLLDEDEEMRNFGMLGRKDFSDRNSKDTLLAHSAQPNMGLTDKIIGSLVKNLMNSLTKEMEKGNSPDFSSFPGGIKIKINTMDKKPKKEKEQKKEVTEEQLARMSSLPREKAKSTIKRLSNKVVCELNASGVQSPKDVFISKLEKGYEIKAIGAKKVYTNSIPVDLPLKSVSLDANKIYIEFNTVEEQ